MSRRLLVVTSTYAPAMIADMQRARILAWELPKFGWDVEILAPDRDFQHPTCLDGDSQAFFPADGIVHSVSEWLPGMFSRLGMRTIGWRALRPLLLHGRALLKTGRFDLVLFSTTQFILFLLGPVWRKQTGVPFVLDFHDPCYRNRPGAIATTKHTVKYAMSQILLKHVESSSVKAAAAVLAVSPKYLDILRARYESVKPVWLVKGRHAVIPFGALERDLLAAQCSLSQPNSNVPEALRLVYVGAGGPIMVGAFRLICQGLAMLRQQNNPLVNRVRVEFFGTMYGWREGDVKHLEQVAVEQGVGDLVMELPQRVSYRRSLELLLEADGALILGVDDEGYMPSKLFSYALSGKPLLASLHAQSPTYELFVRHAELGHTLCFGAERKTDLVEVAKVVGTFLQEAATRQIFDRRNVLEPFLAPAMARRHAELFEACLRSANS